jgi:hypothetical protein
MPSSPSSPSWVDFLRTRIDLNQRGLLAEVLPDPMNAARSSRDVRFPE